MSSLGSSRGKNRNRKNIVYGRTALENIRKSFDKYKIDKERELFSRLQHRIDTEYVKAKTRENFNKRDTKLNAAFNYIKENQKSLRLEKQIKNLEKFRNHSYLYNFENNKRAEKIRKYEKEYKIKDKKIKLTRERELNKRIQRFKEYPSDIITKRLNDIEIKRNLRNKQLKLKLSMKNEYLDLLKYEKEKNCEQKRKELENILKIKNYKIEKLFSEQSKQREEKRKEIDKKNRDYNVFLDEKEKISEEKRNIYDYYINKYQLYSGRIDDILYKKDLDKDAINKIQIMSSEDPSLAGLAQNLS